MGSLEKQPTLAKKRWSMLKDALLKRNFPLRADRSSVRVHNSFSLFDICRVSSPSNYDVSDADSSCWHRYTHKENNEESFSVDIKQAPSPISNADLIGYDNTGNVCIWASEEVMAHYCLMNRNIFSGKNVCEVGGGSTCLAGVFVAKFANPSGIVLSDGNKKALGNLEEIVAANFTDLHISQPNVRFLCWDDESTYSDMSCQFDYVLCADCLFFDGLRKSLAQALHKILNHGGKALIFAPKRGKTFNDFLRHAHEVFGTLNASVSEVYDSVVWRCHQSNQLMQTYSNDIHYPLLLTLTKA